MSEGTYVAPSGASVNLRAEMEKAKAGTRVSRPEDVYPNPPRGRKGEIEVTAETTFAAARRLWEAGIGSCCLNFASAKNPGGGFLNGSQAQEESLARASGLYDCLLEADVYYKVNRSCETSLYTDHAIYSPGVPVFRDDDDQLLEEPFCTSIVTAPAVNAGAVRFNEPAKVGEIAPRMRERIRRVLALAAAEDERTLVLGAWGCGVFKNDPAEMAGWFAEQLLGEGDFARAFDRIVFAVFDRSKEGRFIGPFREVFGVPDGNRMGGVR